MDVSKHDLRASMLFCFKLGKNAAETTTMINTAWGDNSIGASTVRKWFTKFRDGNFDLKDEPRPGPEKQFEDEELQALLDENPNQTQLELAKKLGVTQVAISNRLHAMGKIQKKEKEIVKAQYEQTKN